MSALFYNLKSFTGNGSFRPRVVSALGRFGLGRFGPGSFRPSLVGRFGQFFSTIRLITEGQLNTFWLVGECMGRGKALGLCTGWFTQTKAPVPAN